MKRMSLAADLIPADMDPDEQEQFMSECAAIRDALIAEFSSADLGHRTHGSHKTYMDGCQGPFCKQAHRTYYRSQRQAEPSNYWRIYDPILTTMAEQIKEEIEQAVLRARNDAFKSLGKTDLLHKAAKTPAETPQRTP